MRILFVLPRMVTGGLERVTLNLVKELQNRGHDCAFALRKAYGELLPEAEALCPVYEIGAKGLHQFVPNLSKLIRTWQPTHIVSALSDIGFLTYLAIKYSGQKVFWAHGVHGTHHLIIAQPTFIGRLRFRLDKLFSSVVYQKCNVVIAVSNGVKQDILKEFKCSTKKVITIYNPVLDSTDFKTEIIESHSNHDSPKIIALGRLTRQKGFDILIQAMQKVPKPWHLEIWGGGEEKQNLQNLINISGLQEHIKLKGNTSQPLKTLRQANLFVLSSRYEGFGLVLVEALSCGKKIVATDCPHGPREILESGLWGTLVENENIEALANAIIKNLNNNAPPSTKLLIQRAQAFTVEAATDQWEKVLKNFKEDV
ncbi:glycosyltransferase [Acinetobacter indicus]|uniref:glycosyltransferase n=1 Tax=Acinetobacter indicus TaxID=756892 RepID=UPI002575ED1E|nr:glycosyltransferase [Acinetobacter indicus]MDM1491239.1 glycosyltransferase [Acinetobacter indicus]